MTAAELGLAGERAAAKYYLSRGYRLLAHNYRTRMGELDLVLVGADRVIVICEVKTRSANTPECPAAAVDKNKQRRLIAAAKQYLQQTEQSESEVRFDVAEVTPLDSGRWMVHSIRGAFDCAGTAP